MPQTGDTTSTPVPPRLTVSRPVDDMAATRAHDSPTMKRSGPLTRRPEREHGGPPEQDWFDGGGGSSSRRRNSRNRSSLHQSGATRLATATKSSNARDNPSTLSRSSLRSSKDTRRIDPAASGKVQLASSWQQHQDELPSSSQRSPTRVGEHRSNHRLGKRRRVTDDSKTNGTLPSDAASLLSVVSSLSKASDHSNGSESTITQESYDRQARDLTKDTMETEPQAARFGVADDSASSQLQGLNVFDFLDEMVDGERGPSWAKTFSPPSESESSDDSSSEGPCTPSSRSTFPSPTLTRKQSVVDQKSFGAEQGGDGAGTEEYGRTTAIAFRRHSLQPSVEDCDEAPLLPQISAGAKDEVPPHSRSHSSTSSADYSHRSQAAHEDLANGQLARGDSSHNPLPVRRQHSYWPPLVDSRDPPNSRYHHYAWQYPPMPPTPEPAAQHDAKIVTGYERLALELSDPNSPVKPLYRRFEYLHHRLLLHLQDELCELEEQLRDVEDSIGQLERHWQDLQRRQDARQRMHSNEETAPPPQPPPITASRRLDAARGHSLHRERTRLLGAIFIKTEQYHRALASYRNGEDGVARASVACGARASASTSPVTEEDISAYRAWLTEQSNPIHESEIQFLNKKEDLMILRQMVDKQQQQQHRPPQIAPAYVLLTICVLCLACFWSGSNVAALVCLVAMVTYVELSRRALWERV